MQGDAKDTKIGKNAINNESPLPSWFYEKCSRFENHPDALSNLLNGCIQSVYSALSLYQIHVKYVTTLIISLLTVVGAIFSIINMTNVRI